MGFRTLRASRHKSWRVDWSTGFYDSAPCFFTLRGLVSWGQAIKHLHDDVAYMTKMMKQSLKYRLVRENVWVADFSRYFILLLKSIPGSQANVDTSYVGLILLNPPEYVCIIKFESLSTCSRRVEQAAVTANQPLLNEWNLKPLLEYAEALTLESQPSTDYEKSPSSLVLLKSFFSPIELKRNRLLGKWCFSWLIMAE